MSAFGRADLILAFRRTTFLVAAMLVVVLGALAGGEPSRGAAAQSTIDVYPTAGTSTASPSTQITFRGGNASDLGTLRVTGSSSGVHKGHFASHSDGGGVSFLPDKPFDQGELVTVRSSAQLTRASGGAVKFRILTRPTAAQLARITKQFHTDPEGDPAGEQRFQTRDDLRPPDLSVDSNTTEASGDPIFYAVKGGPGQDGPVIRDARGKLIWFKRVKPPLSPYDFRTQTYLGKPVLTWWQGRVLAGKGSGNGVIYDSSYHLITRVFGGNGFKMDQHEFELTPRGTAFINVYEPVVWNLGKVGGEKKGLAWDSIVQEIDVATGLVLFEWHSLAEVSVSLGTFPYRGKNLPYDPFHVNSVSFENDGNLLLSARNTNALFKINRHTGRVIWRLGGKRSDFQLDPNANTIGQHQAVRHLDDGTITVFDNGGSTRFPNMPDKPSRGVTLGVDESARTVSLLREYHHDPELFSRSQGSMQRLDGGNVFLSWGGGNPNLTEFKQDGTRVFEAHILPISDDTYRAYRLPWSGARPTRPPDVAASTSGGSTTVYASWNGATDVATWEVLAGESPSSLSPAASKSRINFETKLTLPNQAPQYVQVVAKDAGGGVLGKSQAIQPAQG